MRRRVLAAIALLVLIGGGWLGWRWHKMVDAQIPQFVDLPAGPRSPSRAGFFSQHVGFASLEDVKTATARAGLSCSDRSMSTLVKDGVAAAVAQKEDAGESALTYRLYGFVNPHGRNPQVRWDCDPVEASVFERAVGFSHGRLLWVHDAPELPLRHVSLMRTQTDDGQAVADLSTALTQLESRFGADHTDGGVLPSDGGLPVYEARAWTWSWADLKVELSAVRYPDGRTVITELYEVPWPVRSDAPASPRGAP